MPFTHTYVCSCIQPVFSRKLPRAGFSTGHQEALRKHDIQSGKQTSIKWGLAEGGRDPTVECPVMKVVSPPIPTPPPQWCIAKNR